MWLFLLFVWLPHLLFVFLPFCVTVKKSQKDAGKEKTPVYVVCRGCKQKVNKAEGFPRLCKTIENEEKKKTKLNVDSIWSDCTAAQKEEILSLSKEDQLAWYNFRIATSYSKLEKEDKMMMTHRCDVAEGKQKSCETCNNYREFVKDQRIKLDNKYRHLYCEEERCYDEEMQEELDWRLLSWGEVFCPFESGSFKKLKPGKRATPNQKEIKAIVERYRLERKEDAKNYSNGYGFGSEVDPVTFARQKRRELKKEEREERQKRMEKGEKEPEVDAKKREEKWQKEIKEYVEKEKKRRDGGEYKRKQKKDDEEKMKEKEREAKTQEESSDDEEEEEN